MNASEAWECTSAFTTSLYDQEFESLLKTN